MIKRARVLTLVIEGTDAQIESAVQHIEQVASVMEATCTITAGPLTQTEQTAAETTPEGERRSVSIAAACALVGVCRRTLYNWIASGRVQTKRTAGGQQRVYVDTLWRKG